MYGTHFCVISSAPVSDLQAPKSWSSSGHRVQFVGLWTSERKAIMGASSSCCFCIAKAEESPDTENGGVADLERVGADAKAEESSCTEKGGVAELERMGADAKAEESPRSENGGVAELKTVGVEGASTSGRLQYIAKAEESPRSENGGVAELKMVGVEGASTSGRMQYIAKAEESPPTAVDVVAGLEAMTTEEASTSGRSEYYSARCEAMTRSRGQFTDDVALDVAFSTSHCSEVSRLEVAPQSAEEEELNRENREVFKQLVQEYPYLFRHDLLIRGTRLGRMIARGGQAKIYEIVGSPYYLLKVFERGTSLRDLQRSWPLLVLQEQVRQCIVYAGMLEDGRFAFLMHRFWGDLRKLIDQAMQEKNVDGLQGPSFPYSGWGVANGLTLQSIDFMLGIAIRMHNLHDKDISHRDLKASNVLLPNHFKELNRNSYYYLTTIADFECSIGVLGTGYWRAPEILAALGKQETFTNEQWKKADVYSYGMTCFEIVTGRIPFDGELGYTKADRQLVIEGKRPQLPRDLDDAMKDLITKCWAPNPSLRPTFAEVVDMVETISTKQCEFRLFFIDDELPPQYRLVTVGEVREHRITAVRAIPLLDTANLANGSVDGCGRGFYTRFEKRNNARYKLARRHH